MVKAHVFTFQVRKLEFQMACALHGGHKHVIMIRFTGGVDLGICIETINKRSIALSVQNLMRVYFFLCKAAVQHELIYKR